MRKDLFKPLAVLFCLLAIASPVSAQLTIRDNGNAELGTDPFDPATLNPMYYHWLDTVTVLKVFGPQSVQAGGARMTFGDTYLYNTFNVALGEFGNADTDQL